MTDTSRKPNGPETFVCPWWLIYTFDNPVRRLFQPARRILQPLVLHGYTCLDMGCGMGYFTVPMADLVGPTGRVTGVDLQARMLQGVARRAQHHGVTSRISLCLPNAPEWTTPQKYDFILAIWMLHEVSDQKALLETLRTVIKTSGCLLLVEPQLHVRKRQWEESLDLAAAVGFVSRMGPPIGFSRTAIFQ